MKEFSSEVKYVEATPRRQRRKNGSYNVSYGGSTSSGDNSALKSYVDSNFVNRLIAQEIEAIHNFLYGFTIAGIPFRKMDNGSLFIDANVVFGGGATLYGTDSTPAPSIFDGLPIDNQTLQWQETENGKILVAVGGGGGGGVADSVAWANVTGKPTWITNTKPTYHYSEIQGTPDLSVYALASAIPTNNNQLTNGAGYITGITSSMVTAALGYTPLSTTGTAANANKLGGLSPIYRKGEGCIPTITSTGVMEIGKYIDFHTVDDEAGVDYSLRIECQGTYRNRVYFPTTSGTLALTSDIPSLTGYATETSVNTAVNGVKEWIEEQQYLTEITSGDIESILGYQPYDGDTNRLGFLTASALNGYAKQSWVNTTLAGYLPLSGGKVNGSITASSFIGNLTGNADSATKAKSLSYVTVTDLNNVTQGTIFKSSADAANRPSGTTYITGIALATNSDPKYRLILGLDYHGQVFTRVEKGGVWDSWSKLARTSDNVASATKLETPRTIWGQSFDGTGNVVGDLILQSATNVSSNGDSAILRFNGANYATGDIVTGPSIRAIYDGYYARKRLAIFQHNANDYTTESEVFSILPNGNVAIGGLTADDRLHVYGNGKFTGSVTAPSFVGNLTGNAGSATKLATAINLWGQSFDGTGNITGVLRLYGVKNISSDVYLDNQTVSGLNFRRGDNTSLLFVSNNVAVGGTTASAKLHVYGNLLTEGGITMYSQRSLKNILSYEGLSLDQLSVIKPIKFTWKDGRDNRYHVGGVADDVETVVPEVVYSANDFLTMDYGNAGFYVAASLIKPVINHETRIEQLERRVKELENENKQLRQS